MDTGAEITCSFWKLEEEDEYKCVDTWEECTYAEITANHCDLPGPWLNGQLEDMGGRILEMVEWSLGTNACSSYQFGSYDRDGSRISRYIYKRPWENLVSTHGLEAACDIVNELVAKRMEEEHPEYDQLDPQSQHTLWEYYSRKYTGTEADELLRENGYN